MRDPLSLPSDAKPCESVCSMHVTARTSRWRWVRGLCNRDRLGIAVAETVRAPLAVSVIYIQYSLSYTWVDITIQVKTCGNTSVRIGFAVQGTQTMAL